MRYQPFHPSLGKMSKIYTCMYIDHSISNTTLTKGGLNYWRNNIQYSVRPESELIQQQSHRLFFFSVLLSEWRMGSSVALLAVLLVLGLTTGVWSLNPDDPNVCSHWERWASSSRVYLSTLNFSFKRECAASLILQLFLSVPAAPRALNQSSRSILRVHTAVSISHCSSRQALRDGRSCGFKWNTQANWSVYSHPNQSRQP